MIRTGIVVGSTRPGRLGKGVADWVYQIAQKRGDAEFELVDIQNFNLPLLDEPKPAVMGEYTRDHTKIWSAKIAAFDAFVFVTPEYNHGPPAALKNALDFLYREWNDKAAGFVGYGGVGAARAIEHLRGTVAALQIAAVSTHVVLSLHNDFENFSVFKPNPRHESSLNAMLDQVIAWGSALKIMREKKPS